MVVCAGVQPICSLWVQWRYQGVKQFWYRFSEWYTHFFATIPQMWVSDKKFDKNVSRQWTETVNLDVYRSPKNITFSTAFLKQQQQQQKSLSATFTLTDICDTSISAHNIHQLIHQLGSSLHLKSWLALRQYTKKNGTLRQIHLWHWRVVKAEV